MQNTVETYLGRVEEGPWSVPRTYRQDELTELRAHLEELIRQRCLAGDTEAIATADALREFGTANAISGRLSKTWHRGRARTWAVSWGGMVVWVSLLLLLPDLLNTFCSGFVNLGNGTGIIHPALTWMQASVWRVFVGATAAYISPRRALRAVPLAATASTGVYAWFLLLPWIANGVNSIVFGLKAQHTLIWDSDLVYSIVLLAPWVTMLALVGVIFGDLYGTYTRTGRLTVGK